jgi:hypothetical protein
VQRKSKYFLELLPAVNFSVLFWIQSPYFFHCSEQALFDPFVCISVTVLNQTYFYRPSFPFLLWVQPVVLLMCVYFSFFTGFVNSWLHSVCFSSGRLECSNVRSETKTYFSDNNKNFPLKWERSKFTDFFALDSKTLL